MSPQRRRLYRESGQLTLEANAQGLLFVERCHFLCMYIIPLIFTTLHRLDISDFFRPRKHISRIIIKKGKNEERERELQKELENRPTGVTPRLS